MTDGIFWEPLQCVVCCLSTPLACCLLLLCGHTPPLAQLLFPSSIDDTEQSSRYTCGLLRGWCAGRIEFFWILPNSKVCVRKGFLTSQHLAQPATTRSSTLLVQLNQPKHVVSTQRTQLALGYTLVDTGIERKRGIPPGIGTGQCGENHLVVYTANRRGCTSVSTHGSSGTAKISSPQYSISGVGFGRTRSGTTHVARLRVEWCGRVHLQQ